MRFSFDAGVPESASIGERTFAFLIDIVLLAFLNLFLAAAFVGIGFLDPPDPSLTPVEAASDPFVLFVALLEMPVDLVYFIVAERVWGRTVGKLALGLRVMSADGGSPSLGQSAIRNLLRFLWVVPVFLFAFLVIDWYLMYVGEMDQRIGDLTARTFVVRDGKWQPPA